MSGIEVLLAVAGTVVTVLVLAGMVLLVPRGVVEVHKEGEDPEGSNLSPLPNPSARASARERALTPE